MVILDLHCGIKDDDTLWFVPKPTSFYAFFCDFQVLLVTLSQHMLILDMKK